MAKKTVPFLSKLALRKKILKIGSGIFLLLFLSYLGTVYYINSQKNEIASMLIGVLSEQYPGEIKVEDISLDNWVGLTSPALDLKNLTITDTSSTNHLELRLEHVELNLSVDDLLKGLVQIKSATLSDGEILMDNFTPLTREEELELPPVMDSIELNKKLVNKLLEKKTQLTLRNIDLQIRHHVKNKLFKFHINEIYADIEFDKNQITSATTMDMMIDALGFNLEKGQFINGAHTKGSFNSVFDLKHRQLSIAAFDLGIDEQEFKTEVEINFKGLGLFDIVLENERTKYEPTIELLPEKIQQKFSTIKINQPIHTRTELKGSFVYKGNPTVDVKFRTQGNSAVFDGNKPISDLEFSGRFINRVYDDERADTENKKNLRIQLPNLKGMFRDIEFQMADVLLSSSPDAENALTAKLNARGKPSSLNDFLESQHWSFNGGNFELDTKIEGYGTNMANLVAGSYGSFRLLNTTLNNKNNNVRLPVTELSLNLGDDRARLTDLTVPLNSQNHINLRGEIQNFSSLFDSEKSENLRSHFEMRSDNLIWDDFLRLFDIAKSDKKTEKPELVLQKALKDLYNNYDPSFTVSLDRFQFGDITMSEFSTGIHFEDMNNLRLEKTSFGLKGGEINLDGNLNLGYTDKVLITANLAGNGDVDLLNKVFDEDQLILNGGQFRVDAKIKGDLLDMDQILRNSYTSLKLNDTKVTYMTQELELPVKTLDLSLDRDLAQLNALTLHLGTDDEVTFSGGIENLSSLLFNSINAPVKSELHIRSEKLIWEDYLLLFGQDEAEQGPKEQKSQEDLIAADRRLKASMRDIYGSMNPRLTVDIGEFNYQDLKAFHQFHTAISYKDSKTLKLEETTFLYDKETSVKMSAELDISDKRDTYVSLSLEASGNPEELNEVFNNDTFFFRGGEFDVEAKVQGNIGVLDSLVAQSSTALRVKNTSIYHQPSEASIPLKQLEVDLHDNTARLKSFVLELVSGDRITLSGRVGHISDLIFDVPPDKSKATSDIKVYSERFSFEEFQSLFAIGKADTTKSQESAKESPTAIKPTIRDVYNKFRPSLIVELDEFELNGLLVSKLKTGFHFVDQNLLYLEQSGFDFYDGHVTLDAHLDISLPGITYFSFGFTTDKIDLEKLLEAFDYFDIDAMRRANKIGGLVTLDTEIEGQIDDIGGLMSDSLKGKITFNLEDTEVVGFEPMIKSGSKIFKKERLQDIRFGPIKNTLFISDNTVEIPLMEIQSSAFELFVAGHLGLDNKPTNIWIGFPLANLKKRDIRNVPNERGYIEAGKKVYVEAKSDEKKGMKYVLHLNPKKYYKERDMLSTYRSQIKEERQQIREYKRESRKTDREIKKANSTEGVPQ